MDLDLTGLVLPERVETVDRSEDERTAEFTIAPLERGYGHTLGNTVRRILLSSLRGAAVWAFRMDGVLHEHQTVEGVVEDVHQIIQNLKTLVLALEEDRDDAILELRAEKAGAVTAEAIESTGPVTIVNPEHHLFTLQDDREVNLRLYINKGRGFVAAEQHGDPDDAPVDLVKIDAIYNPVVRANFTVEETRVGQRTDFDRLTVLVETNGGISPEDAVAQAAELARRHLQYMLRFGGYAEPEPPMPGAERVPDALRELFAKPLDELTELSVRSVNSLKKEEIRTLGDLVERTEEEMLEIPNFGVKSLEEIREFLAGHNLQFGLRMLEEDGMAYLIDRAAAEAAEAAEADGAGADEAAAGEAATAGSGAAAGEEKD